MLTQDLMGVVMQYAPNFYTDVRMPRWLNAEHTRIECEVNFKHVGFEEYTLFCADPADIMPYSKEIFDRCVAGDFGPIAEYIPTPDPEPIPGVTGNPATPASGVIEGSIL